MPVTCVYSLIGVVMLAATAQEIVRQDPEHERFESSVKRYHALIDTYHQGDDRSVIELIEWDRKRLTEVVGSVQKSARPWDEARFTTAAMLHTDAAIKVLGPDEPLAALHLQLASRLLISGGPDLHPFARRWYLTVARILRERARLPLAETLLERGRQHLPGDPVMLYESGVLQELVATYSAFVTETKAPAQPLANYSAQYAPNSDNTSTRSPNRSLIEWRRSIDNAARWLGDALKADPSSELAQLHFGRVQVLRDNDREASTLLEKLAASSANVDIAYLATMFLGAMHDRRGRHVDAEWMYRQAVARLPAAQSAYIALSEVLQKRGRGDESREVLTTMLQQSADSRTEPWWWYLVDPIDHVQKRTESLRASVRK